MDYQLLLNDSYASHKRFAAAVDALYGRIDAKDLEEKRLSPKRFLAIFDLKLELELLKSALEADAKKGSLGYLRAMSAFCFDILGFGIKYSAYKGIEISCDYDTVLNLSEDEHDRLFDLLQTGIAPLWEEVLLLIAKYGLNEDSLEILEKESFRIGNAFLMADERNSNTEFLLLHERLRVALLDPLEASQK